MSFADDLGARALGARAGRSSAATRWVFDQKTVDPKRAVAIGLPFAQIGVFSFGALVVEVEVDEVTGQGRGAAAPGRRCDVGRAINPALVEGQIEGAFVQGMGFALIEEMVWDGGAARQPVA